MSLLAEMRKRAAQAPKRIVLPEGTDKRIKKAKDYITEHKIADTIVIKNVEKTDQFDRIVDEFSKICAEHKKSMAKEDIVKLFTKNTVYIAAMMVKLNMADGFVAGASHKTSDVARAALKSLSIDETIKVMSGAFIIEVPDSSYGHKGAFVFSDCGIVPFPTKEQLAGIAIAAAGLAAKIMSARPKVAMLSYSTKGSAATHDLDLIREAVELVKRSHPQIDIDGELQVDAALDHAAAEIKHSISGSSVAGMANVLIFPNLDSGNIAYKLIQRLAKARAVGPMLLGLERPCCDLSRACSVEDVIDAVALTGVMAQ
ncbi:MAG: phosphate acetyltransferase [Candidatus Omnitrophica bacterium]|nr:phosphate acetyltransferase [Candidatus Omnitrophota bacterium]